MEKKASEYEVYGSYRVAGKPTFDVDDISKREKLGKSIKDLVIL